MYRSSPKPLILDRIRKITGSFSWIDHKLITQGVFDGLSSLEILLYLWWTLVGDRYGVSFYSDEKTATRLKISVPHVHMARKGLVSKNLIAYQSGITQVLSLPEVFYD